MAPGEQRVRIEQALLQTIQKRTEPPGQMVALLYQELRQIAGAYMRRERLNHSLQATALVHEAYLRLLDGDGFEFENQKHLICAMARTMRRILVDHARHRRAERRGGEWQRVPLDENVPVFSRDLDQLITMDAALERLHKLNARQAQIVELHSFAGLSEEECAGILGVSIRTVKNDWRFAKAWIKAEMQGQPDGK